MRRAHAVVRRRQRPLRRVPHRRALSERAARMRRRRATLRGVLGRRALRPGRAPLRRADAHVRSVPHGAGLHRSRCVTLLARQLCPVLGEGPLPSHRRQERVQWGHLRRMHGRRRERVPGKLLRPTRSALHGHAPRQRGPLPALRCRQRMRRRRSRSARDALRAPGVRASAAAGRLLLAPFRGRLPAPVLEIADRGREPLRRGAGVFLRPQSVRDALRGHPRPGRGALV